MSLFWVPVIYALLLQATVGAALAQHFRASPWQGFWGGFGLGPLGWALIYFIPDKRNKCPHCLEPAHHEASACSCCGQELERTLPAKARRIVARPPGEQKREFMPPPAMKTTNPRDPNNPGTVLE